jgi:hypothetical protein
VQNQHILENPSQEVAAEAAPEARDDPTKFVNKKSKVAAKKGPGTSQWEILRMSGIPEDQVAQVGEQRARTLASLPSWRPSHQRPPGFGA